MAEQRYTIELTSEEITELVSALHAREIALNEAIKHAATRQEFVAATALQRRKTVCARVASIVRVADKP